MPLYRFHITHDGKSTATGEDLDLPDRDAAFREASLLCGDLSRGIFTDAKLDWNIEATDEAGNTIFRFRVLAKML